jgi:16S rRNA (guanine527-N7)-methyltransferase
MFHEEHRAREEAPRVEEGLEQYVELVRHWAERLDLVAPRDVERFRARHVEDALRALPLLHGLPPGHAVDVGSGVGVPGIPLALAQPGRHWRLLEPRRRRAAFLEEVVRELGLDCDVLALRAEEAARRPQLQRHVAATARAVAPPERAWLLVKPLLRPGGTALMWVSPGAPLPREAEVTQEGVAIMRAAGDVEE